MLVLGIHDGHNSSACLVKDGVLLASVQEERITRKKNEVGFPKNAILECLDICNFSKNEISFVVYSSKFMHEKKYLINPLDWYKIGYKEQKDDQNKPNYYKKIIFEKRLQERIYNVKRLLRIPDRNILFLDHHLCHVASSYYSSHHSKKEKTLAISLDGSGDNLSGTVYICKENKFNRISFTKRDASLGKIYSRVTALMGMKPWEHEYKVMGLAPYADHKISDKIKKNVFDKLLTVDSKNLKLKRKSKLSMNYCYEFLKDKLSGERFDNIAGALQKFTEEIILSLVKSAIKKTKIKNLVLSGGVFMNIKSNNKISKIKGIKNLFIMPSSGDESLPIGAAFYVYYQKTKSSNLDKASINDLYLGRNFLKNDEKKEIEKLDKKKFRIYTKNLNLLAARYLVDKKVIGRCSGRAEWGARALGNRSILARSDDYKMVNILNEKIKNRDFWMPFAPIILDKFEKKYLVKKKCKFKPYFMTMTYDVKKKNYNDLICGTHIKDQSARPQILTKELNNSLYDLMKKFSKMSKSGCLINTSFNLHGYPIVNSPRDAFFVFKNSDLDGLLLNNYLVIKK